MVRGMDLLKLAIATDRDRRSSRVARSPESGQTSNASKNESKAAGTPAYKTPKSKYSSSGSDTAKDSPTTPKGISVGSFYMKTPATSNDQFFTPMTTPSNTKEQFFTPMSTARASKSWLKGKVETKKLQIHEKNKPDIDRVKLVVPARAQKMSGSNATPKAAIKSEMLVTPKLRNTPTTDIVKRKIITPTTPESRITPRMSGSTPTTKAAAKSSMMGTPKVKSTPTTNIVKREVISPTVHEPRLKTPKMSGSKPTPKTATKSSMMGTPKVKSIATKDSVKRKIVSPTGQESKSKIPRMSKFNPTPKHAIKSPKLGTPKLRNTPTTDIVKPMSISPTEHASKSKSPRMSGPNPTPKVAGKSPMLEKSKGGNTPTTDIDKRLNRSPTKHTSKSKIPRSTAISKATKAVGKQMTKLSKSAKLATVGAFTPALTRSRVKRIFVGSLQEDNPDSKKQQSIRSPKIKRLQHNTAKQIKPPSRIARSRK